MPSHRPEASAIGDISTYLTTARDLPPPAARRPCSEAEAPLASSAPRKSLCRTPYAPRRRRAPVRHDCSGLEPEYATGVQLEKTDKIGRRGHAENLENPK
ncbi:hypothetical protein EVAR_8960_1 [Eumeta japonica]|uniref:Uncharacterized protein n=1 Tax=Eumeta variegata TaxID=151549 RepID=A0A4C1U0Q9_EUMVA|nr:hypothetical protein EVAR_8960_1 [Eumeta japonica]